MKLPVMRIIVAYFLPYYVAVSCHARDHTRQFIKYHIWIEKTTWRQERFIIRYIRYSQHNVWAPGVSFAGKGTPRYGIIIWLGARRVSLYPDTLI